MNWGLEAVWTLGGIDDHRLAVSELTPHAVASAGGTVFVLNAEAGHVLEVDRSGTVTGSLGQAGEGPGELEYPMAIAAERDGSLSVFDAGKGAFVRWTTDGALRNELPISASFWGPDVEVRGNTAIFVALDPQDPERERLVRSTADEASVVIEAARVPRVIASFPSCGYSGVPVRPFFAPELNWALRDSLLAVNRSAGCVIDILTLEGRPVGTITRPIPPRPVTRSDAIRQAGNGLLVTVPAPCTIPAEELVEERGFLNTLPAIAGLAWSPSGELWVLRGGIADEPRRIDVFAIDGSYMGTLIGSEFPAAFLGPDMFVAVGTDRLGAARVTAYRIDRGDS